MYMCVSSKIRGFSCLNVDKISSTLRIVKVLKMRLLIMYSSKNTEGNGAQSIGKGIILLNLD